MYEAQHIISSQIIYLIYLNSDSFSVNKVKVQFTQVASLVNPTAV